MMRTVRAAAAAAAAALFVGLAGAGSASAEPPRAWLPDADLFCPGADTLSTSEWVWTPGAESLWINTGPLAGHYVMLSDAHYLAPGLLTEPPASYDELMPVGSTVRGEKTGLAAGAITCQFVSRWQMPDAADDFSVVGPITMVRVSG